MTFNGKIVGAEMCPGDRTLIHVEVAGYHPIQMSGECVLTIARAALAPESGGRECRCGCHTRGMCLDCKSEHAPSSPSSAQPDPAALEVTERDRWAWRLGVRQGLETCLKEAQTRSPDVLVDVMREMLKNLDATLASEGR